MPGPWEKYQKVGAGPWEKYQTVEVPKRPEDTYLESAALGAAQGASFGLADEVEGGVKAIKDVLGSDYKLGDALGRYRVNRDGARAKYEKARQDNPSVYTTGEVAGSAATALVPGLGWLNAAKGAKTAAVLGKAATGGAIAGFGTSNADLTKGEVGSAAEDVGMGAGAGILGHGIVSGAGKLARTLTPTTVAKKLSNVFLNTPEELTETYIKNKEGVLNAPRRFELAGEYQGILDKLKGEVTEGSQASRQILRDEGNSIPGADIAALLKSKADELATRSEGVWDDPQQLAAYKWLQDNAEKYGQVEVPLSTNRVKDTLQSIDRSVDFETAPGKFSSIDSQIKGDVRSKIDELLKSQSPAYADQMKGVAADAQLLNQASEVAKSPQGLANIFRRLETDQYGGGQAPRETLEQLDKRMGSDILEKARLSNSREAFDKSITNGSRNVNFFSNMLKDIPVVKYAAPIMGGTVDKYGRKMTMGAVDTAVWLNQKFASGDLKGYADAATSLMEQAKKGNPQAVLTFQMLSQSNPEALKYLEGADQ
jgi:hypothetical protein